MKHFLQIVEEITQQYELWQFNSKIKHFFLQIIEEIAKQHEFWQSNSKIKHFLRIVEEI